MSNIPYFAYPIPRQNKSEKEKRAESTYDKVFRAISTTFTDRYLYLQYLRKYINSSDHQIICTVLLSSPVFTTTSSIPLLTSSSSFHHYNVLNVLQFSPTLNHSYYASLHRTVRESLQNLTNRWNKYRTRSRSISVADQQRYHRDIMGGFSDNRTENHGTIDSLHSTSSTVIGSISYDDLWADDPKLNPLLSLGETPDHLQDQIPMLAFDYSKKYHESLIIERNPSVTTTIPSSTPFPSALTVHAPFMAEKLFGIQATNSSSGIIPLETISSSSTELVSPYYPLVPVTIIRRISLPVIHQFIDTFIPSILPSSSSVEIEKMTIIVHMLHELLHHPNILNQSVPIDMELLMGKRTGSTLENYYIEMVDECITEREIWTVTEPSEKLPSEKLKKRIMNITGSINREQKTPIRPYSASLKKYPDEGSDEKYNKLEHLMARRLLFTPDYVDVYLPLRKYEQSMKNENVDPTFPHLSIHSFAISLANLLNYYKINTNAEETYYSSTYDALKTLNDQFQKFIQTSNDPSKIIIPPNDNINLSFQRRIIRLIILAYAVMDQCQLETETCRSILEEEPVSLTLTPYLFGYAEGISSSPSSSSIPNSSSGSSSLTTDLSNLSSISVSSIINILIKKGDENFGPVNHQENIQDENNKITEEEEEKTKYGSPSTGIDRIYYPNESILSSINPTNNNDFGTPSTNTMDSSNQWLTPSSSVSTMDTTTTTTSTTNPTTVGESINVFSYTTPKIIKQYGRKANISQKRSDPTKSMNSSFSTASQIQGNVSELSSTDIKVPHIIRKPYGSIHPVPPEEELDPQLETVPKDIALAAKLAMDNNASKQFVLSPTSTVSDILPRTAMKDINTEDFSTVEPSPNIQPTFTDDENETDESTIPKKNASNTPVSIVYRPSKHRRITIPIDNTVSTDISEVQSPTIISRLPSPSTVATDLVLTRTEQFEFRSLCRLLIMASIFNTHAKVFWGRHSTTLPINCLCST